MKELNLQKSRIIREKMPDIQSQKCVDPNVEKACELVQKSKVDLFHIHLEKYGLDVNDQIDSEYGTTYLQVAASTDQPLMVSLLLEMGANPCTPNDTKTKRPYDLANDKSTRDAFRLFMGSYPDKWDYSQSSIPSPLTQVMLIAQKEKIKAKKKKMQSKFVRKEKEENEEKVAVVSEPVIIAKTKPMVELVYHN